MSPGANGRVGRVLLAAPRSFCAGVDRAIEIVERLIESNGPPVYVRHEIVHNFHVVRRLEGLGAVFVEHEDEIPPGEICVLSAHGVAPSVRQNCERRGLRVVDAVCPLVSKVHAEARRYADSGHLVALVGHRHHVEVVGTMGERPESTVVVESPEEARALSTNGKPVAVITQTTLSLDDVAPIVDALAGHVGSTLKRPAADDICYATQNRQDAVKEIVRRGATLLLVIGSPTSSNASRLVEVAEARGAAASLIDGESALPRGCSTATRSSGSRPVPRRRRGSCRPCSQRWPNEGTLRSRRSRSRAKTSTSAFPGRSTHEPTPAHGHLPGRFAPMTSVEIPSSVAAALPTLSVFDITNEVSREIRIASVDSGLVYITPATSTSLIRVTERESGFFCDFEELLSRLVPLEAGSRETLILGLLGARTGSRFRSPTAAWRSVSGSGSCSSASRAIRVPTTS